MINRLDALSLRSQVVDNLRVRMAHHSVIIAHKDVIEVSNLIDKVLSNYIDNSLMLGDSSDNARGKEEKELQSSDDVDADSDTEDKAEG